MAAGIRRTQAGRLVIAVVLAGATPAPAASQELAATVAPAVDYCAELRTVLKLREDFRESVTSEFKRKTPKLPGAERKRQEKIRMAFGAIEHTLREQLKQYYPDATDSVRRAIVGRLRQDSMVVSVFGNGNLKTAVADTAGAARVQGALGVVRSTCAADFTVQLNVAATSDTIRANFGTSLLAPATGGFLKAGLVDFRASDALRIGAGRVGIHVYSTASTSDWGVPGTDTVTFQATVLGIGAGIYKGLLRNAFDDTFVAVDLEVGAAYRGLYGDLVSDRNDAIRARMLGSEAQHFLGLELGFSLQVSQVRGGLHFYYFPKTQIAGLGGGQVVAGFALQGGIVGRRLLRFRT
jgi:hypothetical protein